MAAKSQGVQPGAKLREKPPVNQRKALSAVKPKNCMTMSVRKAPMRREAKRAEKSATPQPRAADIPRRMSTRRLIVGAWAPGLKSDFLAGVFCGVEGATVRHAGSLHDVADCAR